MYFAIVYVYLGYHSSTCTVCFVSRCRDCVLLMLKKTVYHSDFFSLFEIMKLDYLSVDALMYTVGGFRGC